MLDVISKDLCRELANRALSFGAHVVVVKAGYKGLFVRTAKADQLDRLARKGLLLSNWADRDVWVPAFRAEPAKIKNACGAGDAAVAAFLTATIRGETVERAALYAALAGRDNLYGSDAVSGLRDRESMTADLARATS